MQQDEHAINGLLTYIDILIQRVENEQVGYRKEGHFNPMIPFATGQLDALKKMRDYLAEQNQ